MDAEDYDPELGPEGTDKRFVPICQLRTFKEKGYIPISYKNYRLMADRFPQTFFMAWAMAGTYISLKIFRKELTAFDMMSEVKLIPRESSYPCSDHSIIGAILLDCPRARSFFDRVCRGDGLHVALEGAYPGKSFPDVKNMVPFPTNSKTAKEWIPFIDVCEQATHPKQMLINVAGFTTENMECSSLEVRQGLEDLLEFTEIDLEHQVQESSSEGEEELNNSNDTLIDGPEEMEPEDPPQVEVKNRDIQQRGYQKKYVPPQINRSEHPFLNWLYQLKGNTSTKGTGIEMYSDEMISDFYASLWKNGRLPDWTMKATLHGTISQLHDYAIWRIKDSGLYNKESLGVVTYVDSKYITETVDSLHKKTERESKAIFNIENMMKTLIAHQKSGSTKFAMAEVPSVLPVSKPLYEEEVPTHSAYVRKVIQAPP